jgi:hypothetical protein
MLSVVAPFAMNDKHLKLEEGSTERITKKYLLPLKD